MNLSSPELTVTFAIVVPTLSDLQHESTPRSPASEAVANLNVENSIIREGLSYKDSSRSDDLLRFELV